MNEQEYTRKRAEILAKFTPDVFDRYKHDGTFARVLEALIRGKDPYDIIVQLLSDRMEMLERIKNYLEHNSIPPLFILKP